MKRRQFLGRIVGLAGLSLAVSACAREDRPFNVGIHPWIGYESLFLAREFGWLPSNVALHEGKKSGDSLDGLKSGRLDAAALTLDEVLTARSAGVPMSIVAILDVSAGADMLLARPDIRKLADLRGRRIGVERPAVGEIVLHRALEAAGLPREAVTVLNIPQDLLVAAWQAGRIDAAVAYEPTASRLIRHGALRLFDSRQIPETIFDVLAVRSDRLSENRRTVRRMVEAHFLGLDHIRVNRQDAIYRIAARQGISHQEVQQALAGVILPNIDGCRQYMTQGSRFMRAAQGLSTWMVEHGLLPRADHLDGLIDASFHPDETPKP